MNRFRTIVLAGLACLPLAGCKFVSTAEKQTKTSVNTAQGDQGFDAKVAALWEPKVIPYARVKAGNFPEVLAAVKADPDAAGAKYGYKEKGGSAPWTLLSMVEGKIVSANTESRAASLDVDADGDGKADVRIQIGPVIRGTAIRDSLDFVNFNDFTNQIDFAQFGKAFNTHVNKAVLEKLPREALPGKTVTALGAWPLTSGSDLPLVTPVTIEIKP